MSLGFSWKEISETSVFNLVEYAPASASFLRKSVHNMFQKPLTPFFKKSSYWLFFAISLSQWNVFAQTSYTTDAKTLAKGQQLFQANCSTCHNFLQKGIGPSLERATTELPADWLKKVIHNAPEVLASGDARLTKLFEDYKQVMPPFTQLKGAEIEAILAFIHKNQKELARDKEAVGAVLDPLPEKIKKEGWQMQLRYLSTAPVTGPKAPLARINKMLVLKGQKDRVFVSDLQGILYELINNQWNVALDIRKERPQFISSPGLATGLGSFAFHPDFSQNGLLYTTHTEKANSALADFRYADSIKVTLQWVVTEWKIANSGTIPFAVKGRELFRINMVSPIHGMQEITFNPLAKAGDKEYGLMYIGIGDGGASENGFPHICNSTNGAWSSVLRIDPLGKNSRNGRYGIPESNPYANATSPTTVKEVFCRGFRNPNRITWSPDGKMLITDIGQTNIEELNLGKAGADYGWPDREGTFVINPRGRMDKVFPLPANEPPQKYTYPIMQYDHDEGKAIGGGFVYQGKANPDLQGKYVFTDINNGRVFLAENAQFVQGKSAHIQEIELVIDNQPADFFQLHSPAKPDPHIGVGLDNEMYVFTKADGKLYQVVAFSRKAK